MNINPNKEYLVMKTTSIFTLIFLTLLPFITYAQQWDKIFPEKGFFVENNSVIQTNDDNYLLFGAYSDESTNWDNVPMIRKINPFGELIWQKDFVQYASNNTRFIQLVKNVDDTFLFAIQQQISPGAGNTNKKSVIIKLDQNGSIIWDYIILPNDSLFHKINTIQANDDGTCSFYLNSAYTNSTHDYVGKMSSDGNLVFLNSINIPWISAKVIDNKNGGYFLREYFPSQDRLSLIEIDQEGNILNNYYFPNVSSEGELEYTASDEFFQAINLDSINGGGISQTRFNRMGIIISRDSLWEGLDLRFNRFTLLNNVVLYAGSASAGNGIDYSNMALMKADLAGMPIWHKIYDIRPHDQAGLDAIPTPDNGILLTGQSFDLEAINWDIRLYALKLDEFGNLYSNTLSGIVAIDSMLNCAIDSNDTPLSSWLITASKDNQVWATNTDDFGFYSLGLDTGIYTVALTYPSSNPYWLSCENDVQVIFNDTTTTEILDFPITTIADCPFMTVSYSMWTLRPCREVPSTLRYCNYGTDIAENVSIEVTFDEAIELQSSSISWSGQSGNTYTFQIGEVAPLECGTININVLLDCDASAGNSYCSDVHIYPDSLCLQASPNWSGALLDVNGICENDSVYFTIENIGNAAMDVPSDYIIVEDAILLRMDSVQLQSGGNINVPLPLNGATYTIWAEQVPNAPGNSNPIAVIEGCGENGNGGISTGFVNQFLLDNGNQFEDTECVVATNSFDPNDKVGIPLGYGPENKIYPNTPIEYTIRFQNTGTDTAFSVIIRDSLNINLDITTLELGASSHDYDLEITGNGFLNFNFINIMLPDSSINLSGSNGFIKYKIRPFRDTPLKTQIKTDAAIYFDFNDPVITNETLHTIDEDFIDIGVWIADIPAPQQAEILIRPNPFRGSSIIEIKDHQAKNYSFELFALDGRLLRQESFASNQYLFEQKNLPKGIYLYRIKDDKGMMSSGKLIIQ